MRALAGADSLASPWVARLSIPTRFPVCDVEDAEAGRLPRDPLVGIACRSSGAGAGALPELAGRVASALRAEASDDALHAAALIDLATADNLGNALDRSISYLEMIAHPDSRNAAAFSDLAAAYLASAVRRESAEELLRALDAASRAIGLDSSLTAARYNRALAMDLLGLDGEAVQEWARYLGEDSVSAWAAEARRRRARSLSRRPVTRPDPDATTDSMVAWAIRFPFEGRTYTWWRLLGEWGSALAAGDAARATRRLDAAARVAEAMASRFGDSSLATAVRDIEHARTEIDRRRLAATHAQYAAGIQLTQADDHRAADRAYLEALADRTIPRTLRDWVTIAHANALVYQARPREAERAALALLDRIDERAHPSLAGRAHWMVGILRLRRGENDVGLASVRRARRAFEWAGERDNVAAALGTEGELTALLGDERAGMNGYRAALLQLRDTPWSTWRHNMLLLLARAASRAGLDRAAAAIEIEDITAADAAGRAVSVVESRINRASALWAAGHRDLAREAFEAADRSLSTLPASDPRNQLRQDLNLALAYGPQRSDPARALALLDSVIAFFTRATNTGKLVSALVARAEIVLALGHADRAEEDLVRAAEFFAAQRRDMASLSQRALLMTRARKVYEGLITLRMSQGRDREALAALEASRTAFSLSERAVPRSEPHRLTVPRLVALDYALIGDTLFVWAIDSSRLSTTRITLSADALRAAVERVRTSLALGASPAAVRDDLAQLHAWLIAPVRDRLGPGERTVAIVADRELAEVPFAALFDAQRGRYFIEDHPIRWSPRLRDVESPRAVGGVPSSVLLVSEPAIDWRAFPSLPPLPGAAQELRAARAAYATPTVLSGAAADSAALTQALPAAEMFHFAGHALLDDVRPERSRLVVGPRGVDAQAIASLDLGRLRLIVLSACETMRAPERRGSGFAGLTEAFLAAGAGGVIGSLWRVNDAHTATLMTAFHEKYSRSGDAVAALREAQLMMLRSPTSGQQSPAAWAAFRYSGH